MRASWTVAGDTRKHVLSLCVAVSAALVKARQLLDEGGDAERRVDEACSDVDASLGAPPMVRRWLDYTSKYGFATLMDDGRIGCCFNDGSIMFILGETEKGVPDVAYIDASSPPMSAAASADDVDDEGERKREEQRKKVISEKVCLCKMFAGLMMHSGMGTMGHGGANTLSGLPSAFNMSLIERDDDVRVCDGSPAAATHVREWVRLKHDRAAAFRLSNQTVHVKFDVADDVCDDFVFNLSRKTVFYRPAKSPVARVCRLADLHVLAAMSQSVYNQVSVCSQALNRFLDQ